MYMHMRLYRYRGGARPGRFVQGPSFMTRVAGGVGDTNLRVGKRVDFLTP